MGSPVLRLPGKDHHHHPPPPWPSKQELEEAFKLFDADGDGIITSVELTELITKVGGSMSDGEATALIHQADKDGNKGIDMGEFTELWAAIRGSSEAEESIRAEFLKHDSDNSGFITKDEMLEVISASGAFEGDKMT